MIGAFKCRTESFEWSVSLFLCLCSFKRNLERFDTTRSSDWFSYCLVYVIKLYAKEDKVRHVARMWETSDEYRTQREYTTLKNKPKWEVNSRIEGVYRWLAVVKLSLRFNWAARRGGVLGEWRHSSTHSLTSAPEWSASRPSRFTPRERIPGTHWIGGWVGPRAVLDVWWREKSDPLPRLEPFLL